MGSQRVDAGIHSFVRDLLIELRSDDADSKSLRAITHFSMLHLSIQ
jgi:hypothetical protein